MSFHFSPRINSETGSGRSLGRSIQPVPLIILQLQRNRQLPAATLGGHLFDAVVVALVGGDAEDPRPQRTAAAEGVQVFHHRQERLLANLLRVLVVEIRGELKNEPPHRRVVLLEQGVPSRLIATSVALNQGAFCGAVHHRLVMWPPYS